MFADRETAARRTACLEHHDVAAGGVAAALTGGFGWFAEQDRNGEKGRVLDCGFDSRMCEISSMGARQRTRGCSPRGLGGVLALIQGL